MIMRAESCVTVSSTWLAKNTIASLDDRKQQREEHRRDQREFDRGRTAAVAAEPAQDVLQKLLKRRATTSENPSAASSELPRENYLKLIVEVFRQIEAERPAPLTGH